MANQDEAAHAENWRGFSCPECHTLFRVSLESVGKQVECPACGEISLIPDREDPSAGRKVPAAPNQFRTTGELGGRGERRAGSGPESAGKPSQPGPREKGPGGKGVKRVRRRIKKRRAEVAKPLDWEELGAPKALRKRRRIQQRLVTVAAGVILLMLAVAALILSLGGGGRQAGEGAERANAGEDDPLVRAGAPEENPDDPEWQDADIEKVEFGATLDAIKVSVGDFLGAESIEEMARFARGGAPVLPRMKEYYEGKGFEPVRHRKISPRGKVLKLGNLWSVDVVLEDHSLKPIALEEKEGGFLVDWESWVGYSELSWAEFLEQKPTEPHLFRVLCTEVSYYNFDFSKDEEWQSFRLLSPDEEHTVYGYVPRHSAMARRLKPSVGGGVDVPEAFIVKLSFPAGATGRNLVFINEVVVSGWILPQE